MLIMNISDSTPIKNNILDEVCNNITEQEAIFKQSLGVQRMFTCVIQEPDENIIINNHILIINDD